MTRDEAIQVLNMVEAHGLADEAKRMAIEALSADTVSREEYEKVKAYMETLVDAFIEDGEELAESVKVVRCKDCRFYDEDIWQEVEDGMPIIVAHHGCKRWGGGCKTEPNGYCYLGERAEQTDKGDDNMTADVCGDNRFEIIERAKNALLESTNIYTAEDEMKVIDSFLFRCWQMGWLDKYDYTDEQTEYKLPGHDEVMEALEKLTIRKVTDKEETEYLNRTFGHDDGEWHDLTDTLKVKPRLIDADALMEKIYDSTYPLYSRQFEGYVIPMSRLEEIINNAPTVSARPHGEWLYCDYDNLRCSNCNYHFGQRHMVYCPNCGAQMDIRGESEDKR